MPIKDFPIINPVRVPSDAPVQSDTAQRLKRPAVVFDIDGTLALCGPPVKQDWNDVEDCEAKMRRHEPNWILLSLMNRLHRSHEVVLSTARPERFRHVTEYWLAVKGGKFNSLLMRSEDALELSDKSIKIGHLAKMQNEMNLYVEMWFDDRDSVVDALRGAGILVLQVARGDF